MSVLEELYPYQRDLFNFCKDKKVIEKPRCVGKNTKKVYKIKGYNADFMTIDEYGFE